jgi:hypothetical protein
MGDVTRINAKKLAIAIRALSDISARTHCGDHCAVAAARALREMGKVNMRDLAPEKT